MAYTPNNANGQATMANSAPVVVASDQTLDVSANDVLVTGTITAADVVSASTAGQGGQLMWTGVPTANSTVVLSFPLINTMPESLSNVVIFISGTFTATYVLERSPDNGTTWTAFSCFIAGQKDTISTGTLPGMFHGNVAGTTNIRIRCTAFTSGSMSVRITAGIGTGTVTVGNPIRIYDTVNKNEGTIKAASTAAVATDTALVVAVSPNNTVPVSGTFWQATQPVSGTFWQATQPVSLAANQSVNNTQIGGVAIATGNGVVGTGVQRVAIASDNSTIPVSIASAPTIVTSSAPATSGGLSTFHLVSAATTNATVIKASVGQVFGWFIYNSNAAARKVTFHNSATAPTAGAGTFFSLVIPPGSGANVEMSNGVAFSAGIAITTTTGLADTDATAVAATDLIINIFYK